MSKTTPKAVETAAVKQKKSGINKYGEIVSRRNWVALAAPHWALAPPALAAVIYMGADRHAAWKVRTQKDDLEERARVSVCLCVVCV